MPLSHTWRPLSGPLQPLIKLRSLRESQAAPSYRGTPRERPQSAHHLLSPLARKGAEKRGRGAGGILCPSASSWPPSAWARDGDVQSRTSWTVEF